MSQAAVESWQRVDPAELAALAGAAGWADYFAAHPELRRPQLAWRLAEESGRALRTDLERAAALAAAARRLAEELNDTAANVLYFQRRYEEAVAVYERSLAGFEEGGAELEAAITRSSAIGSLSHLARYEEALELAAGARRVFESHDDLLHLARLEVAVGHIRSRQDRFPEALRLYRRALDRFRAGVGQPVDVASTLRNIAVCQQDLNDFRAALAAYREARDYCAGQGQPLIGLEVEYNIAYLYFLRGEYTEAIRRFEAARRHSHAQGDQHHAALCDLDLAEIFLELNLVQDAEHLAAQARGAFTALGMEYETAKALCYQALATARRGDRETPLELLARARALFAAQGNRVWAAMADLYQAHILFASGRLQEALPAAEAAHEGFSGSGVASRTVASELLLARLKLGLGDRRAARERAASALTLARDLGRPLLEFQAHLTTGQIEEMGGELEAALAAYGRAHRAIERLRGQLPTDELKIAFTTDKQAVYEGLVVVSLSRGGSAAEIEAALTYVETAKSRSLADQLAFGSPRGRAAGGDGDPLLQEIGELRQEIAWYYRQMHTQELAGGEAGHHRLAELRSACQQRERRLLRALRRLQPADAELASLQGAAVADPPALRAVLPEDACIVEYFIARGLLYAFILDHRRLEVRTLGQAAAIRKLHGQLQFQLGKFGVGGGYLERYDQMFREQTENLLAKLHRALFGDWRPRPEVRRLILVPHGFLHQVPFHALRDGERHLIDRLAVSYAPSATVFQLCATRRLELGERSLVLGIPDERAPKILDEVQAVAETLPASRLLLGREATTARLARLGDGCRFLHIATHGFYRKDNPMFSAIQLGDRRLSLLDLYEMRLRAELAVLSGCGTGLSDVQGSEELVGLTRGLLFAGARSVLATLWDVNDESTAEFMRRFYGRLTAGLAPAAAVREAMIALRNDYPHPYYWAPFVLTGHG